MSDQNVTSYRELLIWQKGINLVKEIYKQTRRFPKPEEYALTNQIRRAAISVPSNIAEGQARQHTGEFRQFLYTALGSLAEIDTQLTLATELKYIEERDAEATFEKIIEIRKMINAIVSKLQIEK